MTDILVFLALGTGAAAILARWLDRWHRRHSRGHALLVTVALDMGAVNEWHRDLLAEFDDIAGWIVARMRDKDLEADA